MPGLDRRGPAGAGPMTGGRRGLCGRPDVAGTPAGYGAFGYGRGAGFGRGAGRGTGRGRCRRLGLGRLGRTAWERYPAGDAVSRQAELAALRADADYMKNSLEGIEKRIVQLDRPEAAEE